MAIRLHIQENRVRLSVGGDTIHLSATEKMPVYPDPYTGAYEVTPIEAEQSLVSHGLMMTDDVTVHAIASDYVGSGISRRSSTDITASGATVSVPSGFYESPASKSVASGSASTPATSITATPSISVSQSGLITASVSASKDVTPSVSPGYVESGSAGTVSVSGSKTSQLSTQQGATISPTESEQTAVGANKYTLGEVKVGAIPNDYVGSAITQRSSADLTASGATVTAPSGYYANDASKVVASGTAGTPTASKGTVSNHSVSVTPSVTNTAGYISGGTKNGTAVSVSASELVSGTKSISANGTGIDVTNYASVDVAVPSVEPNLQEKTNIAPSTSSQTITADSGYDGLSSVQINAMPSGSAGTPTATKGTVSNHSVSVTPSVTNTTGYITGGTKTGTAVSVSASDLVSGTLSITSSGTKDVTNYASASVASGGATASATKGTVSNHSVTVTPSVTRTAGYITAGTASGTAVTVSASELVSGSETKTANGTYDVTNLAELVVNVSGGGGASNFVHGEFTTQSSAGVQSVSVPYTGTGYPIMIYVVIKGGAYVSGTAWYTSTQRYAIGVWACSKSVMSSTPTYTTSGTQNQAVTMSIYKNSTSSSTSYTRTSAMNTNTFSSSNATNAAATAVRYKSGNTLSVYVHTSSYGLFPSQDYEYFIVYSS